MCRHENLSKAATDRVLDICMELDVGDLDDGAKAYPGEPAPPGDAKPLEVEEFIYTTGGSARLAGDVLEELEAVGVRHALPRLNPGGLLSLRATLEECGLRPIDIWPAGQQDAVALSLAGRAVRHLPCYFEPLLIHVGCRQALANLTEPGALAEAHATEERD